MAKSKSKFICQNCGQDHIKWSGRCDNCGQWNSLVEQVVESGKSPLARSLSSGKVLKVQNINDIDVKSAEKRLLTGIDDLDLVLGGGIVPGGVVLLAGQPGIGKSTLLMQISNQISSQQPVLYVSGEESASQVRLRAKRLSHRQSSGLEFVASTSADDIAATIRDKKHKLVVIDSIQTLSLAEITSAPGTVSQITNSSNLIIRAAKESGAAVVLVGHVTKEGSIAGPKVLEHLVDVVLQFEGDRYGGFKVVRAIKNRYGSTNEAAIFEMKDTGLEIVKNPSAALLAERDSGEAFFGLVRDSALFGRVLAAHREVYSERAYLARLDSALSLLGRARSQGERDSLSVGLPDAAGNTAGVGAISMQTLGGDE